MVVFVGQLAFIPLTCTRGRVFVCS